jgi:translation elongation factor EF-G
MAGMGELHLDIVATRIQRDRNVELKTSQPIVVYRELDKDDGFIITAFFTRRLNQIERRPKLWP